MCFFKEYGDPRVRHVRPHLCPQRRCYDRSTQDLYRASSGPSAAVNNRRMRVGPCKEMERALIGTGVPLREEYLDRYMPMLRNVAANSAGIRRAGAASLDLAYVASGRLDGYWEFNLKPWEDRTSVV